GSTGDRPAPPLLLPPRGADMRRTEQNRQVVEQHLSPAAAQRQDEMTEAIAADPAAIARLFPAAAREVARGPLDPADPSGVLGPTLDDAVRGVLITVLAEAQDDPERTLGELADLYRYGDGDEKRAVLRALDLFGPEAGTLVEDALRTNDIRDRKSTRLNSSHVSISYAVF